MNTEDLCIRIYLSTSPDWWGRDVHHLVWCEANNILAGRVEEYCKTKWPFSDIVVYAGLYQPTAYYVTAYYNVRELHKQCEYDTTVIEDIKHWVNKHKDAILNTAQERFNSYRFHCWDSPVTGMVLYETYNHDAAAIERACRLSRQWRDVEVTRKGKRILWLKEHGKEQYYPPQED